MALPNVLTRSILLLILSVFHLILHAQVKGTCNYSLTINDGLLGKSRVINSILYFSGNKSLEMNIPKNVEGSIMNIDNATSETKVINTSKKYFVFKNFGAKELQLSDNILAKYYLITDTLSNFKWKISKEKRKILKYSCTKATASFRGREYEAWFADEIAISNGPWKFCGLPGLIVAVKDANSIYSYELTGINLKASFDPAILTTPKVYQKDKPITQRDFINAYKSRIKQNEALSRVTFTGDNGTTGNRTITMPEKMEKF
ncbi:GLPGLI family protein [Pedobacter sp. ok626]|uniref:GLPGLI family protein n=1 Tax=Pedobacter sp. ok626 TaxID=1761882 RepID=UPI00087EDB75|nr:GLPGLI family protein [Pedobacter sp. ok626]SDL76656.1 GLPGLI family protein [Pedobacter sp. ok626]